MKKTLLISTLIVSSLLMAEQYDYEVTPLIGYNFTQGKVGLKNAPLIGVELKYNTFSHEIKPEFSVLYSKKVETIAVAGSPITFTDFLRISVDGVYDFKKNHRNKMFKMFPFVKAGIGYEYFSGDFISNDSNFFLDAGLGVKFLIANSLSFKTEAVYMIKNNHSFGDRNLAILAGLTFAFGDSSTKGSFYVPGQEYIPATEQSNPRYITPQAMYLPVQPMYVPNPSYVPAQYMQIAQPPRYVTQNVNSGTAIKVENMDDSDGDGVKDSKDKCPNTKKGLKVNKKGCLKGGDDDNDGIKNSKDKCPDTPLGIDVNKKGCIKDKDDDKDGVKNSKDRCPDTPIGIDVNKKGCIKVGDEDRDGILDDEDVCPTTPFGVEVNDEGCALTRTINISFNSKSTDIATDSLLEVQRFADFLDKNRQYHVTIVGHTDNRGSSGYNKKLSKKRANAVKDMLIENGVLNSRLSARGDGERYPLVENTTDKGRAKNRRIEVVLEKVY